MYIYIDGKVLTIEEARISPFDHGFMYGLGAFETFRTYEGAPFLIDDHIDRLNEALKELNIAHHVDADEITKIVKKLLAKNELKDAYFRLNISAGAGDIGLQTSAYEKPTMILYTKPLVQMNKKAEKELVVLQTIRNTPEGKQRLKSHHYLNSILGKRELTDGLAQEGLFLTEEGYVSEGTVSNLFWVIDDVLYSPCVSTGILDGITRKWVLNASELLNIPVKTGKYKVEDLKKASEVFLTNSIQELVPVSRLEASRFAGADGTIIQKLLNVYEQHTKEKRTRI
jgi:4-amino-4-deoxychorismate lyase